MADAAVEFLLTNLGDLLRYHFNLIKDAEKQVEKLANNLRLFKAFLKDTAKKRRKDDTLKELVRQIRDVVYMAEDTIDAFVTQTSEIRSKNYFARALRKPLSLHDIATQVEVIGRKVTDIYKEMPILDLAYNIKDGDPQVSQSQVLGQKRVVGFEDEEKKILGYLRKQTDQLDVISVVGMPGLGKTTLTWKIFHDEVVEYEFPTRIWVYVSHEFSRKNVYLAILKEFMTITEDISKRSDQELAQMVFGHLERGKFFIVMDDVSSDQDWDDIEVALPKSNNAGKVIITSRSEDVARHANRLRDPHNLRSLTQDESWLLLRIEALGKPDDYPSELESHGKLIAKRCGGLPLAIVIIGGILAKSLSKRTTWEKVSKSVGEYLTEDPHRRMENIIALSYDKLPYHLRACFLYLGMFPEDFEIPVWKLTRMWIAEGFIQKEGNIPPEEIAENYLDQLMNRNLVKADKRRHDGSVKTCRIHDMLRDFCKKEGGNERENFLQEIKSSEGMPSSYEVQKYRRICIHSNVKNFLSSKPIGPQVRSFACFAKEDISLSEDNTSAIPAAFKLMRVLDVKPIKFKKIPTDVYQLFHLRYITLSFDAATLPPAFAKLWNIQTLIVDTTSRTLEIKADIWKLRQLRHVKTNASASLPKPGKDSKEGEKLQTLGTISPQSCTEEVFGRARNIKKLGIRGKLALFLEGKSTVTFDSVGKLERLENLKLWNDVFPNPASEGRLRGLPPTHQFPPTLKSLTLTDTYLDWIHMSTLALLEKLEVLKLKQNAFMGSTWEPKEGGFRCLELLHIGHTDLVCWNASANHFPKLRHLHVHNCDDLLEIPFGLADAPNFQLLDLYCSTNAAKSAKKIRDAKKNIGGEFKLTIFPPDE